MNDRYRPDTSDAGEPLAPGATGQSSPHHVSRRPVLLAAFLSAGSLAGCSLIPGSSSASSSSPSARPTTPKPAASSATPSPTAPASGTPSATATATTGALAGWSLEEKVGQLMMVGVDAQAPTQASAQAVETHHVGNIFIAGRTTAGSQATQKVISSFTSKVGPATTHATPMLVATDQEGGEVQVLSGSGFSDIPSALDQSAQPRDQLVASARTWGKELADAGVNMNLAPVVDLVDISRPTSNEPIGRWGREYGHDAAVGVFANAIAAGAQAIMVSSATYSLIDSSAPAVFSSKIVTDMLRREMGFSGVVITDDVSAAVQVQEVGAGDRAVRAIRAGCDLVLASADPTVVADMVKALIATAQSDPAFAARVDESATRVLNLKKSLQS